MDDNYNLSRILCEALSIDSKRSAEVRVLIITGYGLNCEEETVAGFRMLGAQVDAVHLSVLLQRGSRAFDGFHLVVFIGGFSFGDHVASGRILANRFRFQLGESIHKFIDNRGLLLGICNGFQVMTKLGVVPNTAAIPDQGTYQKSVSLLHNQPMGYRNAWIRLGIDSKSPCVFTRGIDRLDCPIRHAEGRMVFASAAERAAIESEHLIPIRYVDQQGCATEDWPHNPNGSPGGAAGLCDSSGRVFGLMPHPEAFLYPHSHPRWIAQRQCGEELKYGQGLRIFANGVRAALEG